MIDFMLKHSNVICGINLFLGGLICSVVEVEPGVHDLTPFIVLAALGFVFIFYLKPEDFNDFIRRMHGSRG